MRLVCFNITLQTGSTDNYLLYQTYMKWRIAAHLCNKFVWFRNSGKEWNILMKSKESLKINDLHNQS